MSTKALVVLFLRVDVVADILVVVVVFAHWINNKSTTPRRFLTTNLLVTFKQQATSSTRKWIKCFSSSRQKPRVSLCASYPPRPLKIQHRCAVPLIASHRIDSTQLYSKCAARVSRLVSSRRVAIAPHLNGRGRRYHSCDSCRCFCSLRSRGQTCENLCESVPVTLS